jgi:hypothetical protein
VVSSSVEKIEGTAFELDISGAGNAKLSGEVERFQLEVSGTGSVDAVNLKAKNADVNLSGAGNAKLYAEEKLVAGVSGVGNLTYFGSPKIVKSEVTGVGVIREGKDLKQEKEKEEDNPLRRA